MGVQPDLSPGEALPPLAGSTAEPVAAASRVRTQEFRVDGRMRAEMEEIVVNQPGNGPERRDYFIIANPTAGRGRVAQALADVKGALEAAGVKHHIAPTEWAGHATELAQRAAAEGWKCVVSVGGDGTMGEVLNGIMAAKAAGAGAGAGAEAEAASRPALGLIPLGTGNDLARTFGVPLNVRSAIDVLLGGRLERIDLGKETDGYFAIVQGLGFAADVMDFCNTHSGWLRGSPAIFAATAKLMFTYHPYPMRVVLDDQTVEGDFITTFVMNTRLTGGGMLMCPDALTDDGLLDICLIKYVSRSSFLPILTTTYSGGHVTHPAVSLYRSRKVRIECAEPMRKMYDGNVPHVLTPAEMECVPRALDLVVPRAAPAGGVRGAGAPSKA